MLLPYYETDKRLQSKDKSDKNTMDKNTYEVYTFHLMHSYDSTNN